LDEHGRLTAAGKSTKQLLSEKSNRPEYLEIVHGAYFATRNSLEITIQHPELAGSILPIAASVGKVFVTVRNLKLGEPNVCQAAVRQPRVWQLT
jgi:hypothetical protein